MADDQEPASAAEGTFLTHLLELRNRLVYALAGVAVVSAPLVYFANEIYDFIAKPLRDQLPAGSSIIATSLPSTFMEPVKLAIVLGFIVAAPWVLYQVWAFVAPGLYRHERRLVAPLIISSTLLFYAGMAFAYFIVFPGVFYFFIHTAPPGVTVMTDIKSYLDFVFGMFIAFGIAFEVPVAVVLLAYLGVINPESLAQKRPYVFLGVFVVAAVLTPPDIFSQTALALPMYALFEVGLFVARRGRRRAPSPSDAGGENSAGKD